MAQTGQDTLVEEGFAFSHFSKQTRHKLLPQQPVNWGSRAAVKHTLHTRRSGTEHTKSYSESTQSVLQQGPDMVLSYGEKGRRLFFEHVLSPELRKLPV